MRMLSSSVVLVAVLALLPSSAFAQTFNFELDVDGTDYHQTHVVLPLPPLGGGPSPIVCDDYLVIGEFYDYSWRPAYLDWMTWYVNDDEVHILLPVYELVYTFRNGSSLVFKCFRYGSVSVYQDGVHVAEGTYTRH